MNSNHHNLSPELLRLAALLAEKHKIPQSDIVHPKVFVPDGRGGVDEFMTAKLRSHEDDGAPYVPYCMKHSACGRLHRTEFGFQCPRCYNKANWDLTRWNGNANVQFEGEAPAVLCPPDYQPPPPPAPITPLEARRAWNACIEKKKRDKAQRKAERK